MRENVARDASLVEKYTWTRPQRLPVTTVIDTFSGVEQILSSHHFMSAYNDRMFNIIANHSMADMEDEKLIVLRKSRSDFVKGRCNIESLLPYFESSQETWAEYFRQQVGILITEKAVRHVGDDAKYVNLVGDVINLVPVRWVSEKILGLPLKTVTNRSGAWYEQDVYKMFAHTAHYVFLNFDPGNDWHLRESSIATFGEISKITKAHLDYIGGWVTPTEVLDHTAIENHDCHKFLKRVQQIGSEFTTDELAAQAFSAVVPTAAHFSQAIAHVINFYLDDDKQNERDEIVKLASASRDKDVMVYVREALRLDPFVPCVYRTAARDAIIGNTRIEAGQRIFANVVEANLDTSAFGATPTEATYDKLANKAGIFGLGDYGLLSAPFFESTVPAIVGIILGLKNLKRAPGRSGNFSVFKEELHGCPRQWYINLQGETTPFPDSLVVQFD